MRTDFDRVLEWAEDQGYNYESSDDYDFDYGSSEYIMVDLPVALSKDLDDNTDKTTISFCFNFEMNTREIKGILVGNVVNIPCTELSIIPWRDEFRLDLSPSNVNIYIRKN